MTVAALQAQTLQATATHLHRHPSRTRTVQRRLARRTHLPWILATALDSQWADPAPRYGPLVGTALNRMLERVGHSPHLYSAFFKTQHLMAPIALLHPLALATLLRPTAKTPDAADESGIPTGSSSPRP
ncbi:hypothetical protein [Streptomyces halobius]|uniref:Uncharacterized protein n=1 Tax=Streptomyces halobius TaxID=2879846 RepID=A0ABY4M428_9ACTN|nr:hypothetical protein [Streptomyces halobius]UQA92499.1 hypothetical protein K9S39_12230 [Streptomyces halobius]